MQVDPIKPMLKTPRTKRLKLTNVRLLSNFGFKFNLRRYNLVGFFVVQERVSHALPEVLPKVSRCRLTLSNPR